MQEAAATAVIVDTLHVRAVPVVPAVPVANKAPVELPLDQLEQIVGGGPKGTW